MFAASNIQVERHAAIILSSLTGGSLVEILAYFGPDGPPPEINTAALWIILTNIFTQVDLGSDRDNRFVRVKLEHFSSIGAFQELSNSISGIPWIKLEMEKALKANPDVGFYDLMQTLKSCEVLMPK